MRISEGRNKFIFQTKVDIGEGEFILMREPFMDEVHAIRRVNKTGKEGMTDDEREESLGVISRVFERCIIGSSFTLDDGTPAPPAAVLDFLKESGNLYMKAFMQWQNALPLAYRAPNEPPSETSVKLSSEEETRDPSPKPPQTTTS
jgi:hypothetical protein